ncbi:MAG: hemin uptake protein HemP [Beijerinckiaceae bacterium]
MNDRIGPTVQRSEKGDNPSSRSLGNGEAFGGACVVLDAAEIMNGCREAVIIHNGERYRLRITSKQRLILTK